MRNGKWLQRLMVSYLPLFFIMVSVLVFIFFLAVNGIAEKENKRANEQFARQLMQLLDNEIEALNRTFLADVYFSEEVQLFFNPFYEGDIALNYEMIKRLQDFVASSGLVDSVYAYRESDGNVLSDSVMIQSELYPDIGFGETGTPDGAWSGRRLFKEFGESRDRAVVSSVHNYPLTGEPRGRIVFNVNVNALQARFVELGRVDLSYAYVLDGAGEWLLGTVPRMEAEGLKRDISLTSGATGWTLYSGVNEHYLFGTLQLVSRIWIIAGAAIILGGFAWLIYLIRRNYRPVEALAARIESFSLRKSMELRGSYDEFNFIENALNAMMEDAQTSHKQLKDSLSYKEKILFQELTEGAPSLSVGELRRMLGAKGLEPDASGWRFVLFEMDHYRRFEESYSGKDQLLLKFALYSVVKEMADQREIPIWMEWVSDKAIGVFVRCGDGEQGMAQLPPLYEDCLRWVETHLSFTVTIAEGSLVDRPEEAYLSYDAAQELLRFKPTVGSNRWLSESLVKELPGMAYYELLPEVHALTEAFRIGKDSWEGYLETIEERITDNHMARNDIVNLFEFLAHKLNGEIGDIADGKSDYWNEDVVAALRSAIGSFETAGELTGRFRDVLTASFRRMARSREASGSHAMIEKAKTYIEERYADDTLSLNGISEELGMNPAGFSRAFKQGTGEKFVDYVTRLRIDRAKTALAQTDESIQDIGASVGYVHAVSFNRAFKKAVGITPGDYRKRESGQ